MPLTEYLTPARTLLLQGRTKGEVLEELVGAVRREDPELDREGVVRVLLDREKSVSSRIAPTIALPHALLPGYGKQIIAVGYSPAGVPWDSPEQPPVNLIVVSLCDERQASRHIHMLGEIAHVLSAPSLLDRISSAGSAEEVYDSLLGRRAPAAVPTDARKERLCRSLVEHACALVQEAGASAVMVLADADLVLKFLEERPRRGRFILATSDAKAHAEQGTKFSAVLDVPFLGLRRADRVKLAFLFALSHGVIDKGDIVVCVSGDPAAGMLHALEIIDVAEEFHVFLSLRSELTGSDIDGHVLDRVLHMAAALARQGREGRPVGAIFVLGDYENVRKRCHQLVMNPFRGYPEDERNVLDPSLEETVKEFSRIDGAFIIRGDGVIMSMGSYIETAGTPALLESGLGARHTAAMAITTSTQALSIVISESTHRISLFKRGKLVMALEQALR